MTEQAKPTKMTVTAVSTAQIVDSPVGQRVAVVIDTDEQGHVVLVMGFDVAQAFETAFGSRR